MAERKSRLEMVLMGVMSDEEQFGETFGFCPVCDNPLIDYRELSCIKDNGCCVGCHLISSFVQLHNSRRS